MYVAGTIFEGVTLWACTTLYLLFIFLDCCTYICTCTYGYVWEYRYTCAFIHYGIFIVFVCLISAIRCSKSVYFCCWSGVCQYMITYDLNWVITMLSQPIKSSLSNIIIFAVLNFEGWWDGFYFMWLLESCLSGDIRRQCVTTKGNSTRFSSSYMLILCPKAICAV